MSSWFENTEKTWRELDMHKLRIDESYVRVISSSEKVNWLYTLSHDCYKCPFTRILEVPPMQSDLLRVDTKAGIYLRIYDEDHGLYANPNKQRICEFSPELGEFGVYNLSVTNDSMCSFSVDKDPVNIYLPLIIIITALLLLGAVYQISLHFYKQWPKKAKQTLESRRPSKKIEVTVESVKHSLRSFPTYRGMAVLLMVFANSGGGGYGWVFRVPWNGVGLMDLVFPAFNWILGAFTFKAIRLQLDRDISKKEIIFNNAWNATKLFAAGVFLNSIHGPNLEDLRIMGILQRLGIANLVLGSLYTITSPRTYELPENKLKRFFWDILFIKYLWLVAIGVTVIYALFAFLLEVPDCPSGYFGPGGIQDMLLYENCTGGASGYIDMLILGARQIHASPPAIHVYKTGPFDSEGLLGCLPTIVQTIMGFQCASTLHAFTGTKSKMIRWLVWGMTLGILSGALCKFSWEDGWIPINRSLMSLSFIYFSSSIGFILHAIIHYLVDIKNYWTGSPFEQCGKNSLLIYMGHLIVAKMLPWSWSVESMNTHIVMLVKAFWTTGMWIALATYWERIEFIFVL